MRPEAKKRIPNGMITAAGEIGILNYTNLLLIARCFPLLSNDDDDILSCYLYVDVFWLSLR